MCPLTSQVCDDVSTALPRFINIRDLSDAYTHKITESLIGEFEEQATLQFKLDDQQRQLVKSNSRFCRVLAPARRPYVCC